VGSGQVVLEAKFDGAERAVTGLAVDAQGRTYVAAAAGISLLAYDCPPVRDAAIYVAVAVLGVGLCLVVFAVACWSAFTFGHALRQGSAEEEAAVLPPEWPPWKRALARGYLARPDAHSGVHTD
jgi:hypothetical protein